MYQIINLDINMNRIIRQLLGHIKSLNKENKQKNLFKVLKKEVDIGANGTQGYTIKNGSNKGKVLNASK